MSTIKPEWIINRQGKDMILYQGLLALAHERGIKSIRTSVYQPPLEGNGYMAICTALVTMADGSEWAGVGDADKGNVNRNIAPHIVRMAETRAKARALRDALNIGMVAAEELDVDEGEPAQKPTPIRQTVTKSTVNEATQAAVAASDQGIVIRRERLATLQQEVTRKGKNWDTYKAYWLEQVKTPIEEAGVDQLQAAIEKQRAK